MEDEENISIENLDQVDVLEQQIQTYIIQIMNEDATKQEKIQHLHRYTALIRILIVFSINFFLQLPQKKLAIFFIFVS